MWNISNFTQDHIPQNSSYLWMSICTYSKLLCVVLVHNIQSGHKHRCGEREEVDLYNNLVFGQENELLSIHLYTHSTDSKSRERSVEENRGVEQYQDRWMTGISCAMCASHLKRCVGMADGQLEGDGNGKTVVELQFQLPVSGQLQYINGLDYWMNHTDIQTGEWETGGGKILT